MTIHLSNAARVAKDTQGLGDRLTGRVLLSGEEGWELARQAWNLGVASIPIGKRA
jgi:hypothetical protein